MVRQTPRPKVKAYKLSCASSALEEPGIRSGDGHALEAGFGGLVALDRQVSGTRAVAAFEVRLHSAAGFSGGHGFYGFWAGWVGVASWVITARWVQLVRRNAVSKAMPGRWRTWTS
jgi:hypothetical protein